MEEEDNKILETARRVVQELADWQMREWQEQFQRCFCGRDKALTDEVGIRTIHGDRVREEECCCHEMIVWLVGVRSLEGSSMPPTTTFS